MEEFANTVTNKWLRQDIPEGAPPDTYALIVLVLAKRKQLVLTDEEIEKAMGEVEAGQSSERECEE